MTYGDRILIFWKDVEKNCGLTGPHANDIVKMVNNMLATEWLADVSQCLEETLEAGNLTLKWCLHETLPQLLIFMSFASKLI